MEFGIWFKSGSAITLILWTQLLQYEGLREATLSWLLLADNYTVFIKSMSAGWKKESKYTYLQHGLRTKTCLQAHGNNLALCRRSSSALHYRVYSWSPCLCNDVSSLQSRSE